MKVLGIDTSGKIASVSICDESRVIAQNTVLTNLTHSQVILPLCKKMLEDASLTLDDIDGIAVANGPGSYTGLRIGISAVKAIAFAKGIKVAGISTLKSLCYNLKGYKGYICSVMAARADLVYSAVFYSDGININRVTEDEIISISNLCKELELYNKDVILVGDNSEKIYGEVKELGSFYIAPPHLRMQLSSSLCYAAMEQGFLNAEDLNASYLQATKAEKDKGIG